MTLEELAKLIASEVSYCEPCGYFDKTEAIEIIMKIFIKPVSE
jgi:hypothetical protein